ncbi:ribbon-helix-helix domain-containing protein [Dickeya sp. ws52]|uniref:ribbon-helix-helix domain-containing protein n=1 Tax=Dickeya sp. ws52 TaxID=2576377 RepID=UPI00118058C3|nr:CopG family transcriptional regulator [Dickeya sp. ws52]
MIHTCDASVQIPAMKSTRTTVSLTVEQLQSLQEMADMNGLSISWLIRQAVSDFLAQYSDKKFEPLRVTRKESE